MDISVAVCTFNRADHLPECVAHLDRQQGLAVVESDVVIVDNEPSHYRAGGGVDTRMERKGEGKKREKLFKAKRQTISSALPQRAAGSITLRMPPSPTRSCPIS